MSTIRRYLAFTFIVAILSILLTYHLVLDLDSLPSTNILRIVAQKFKAFRQPRSSISVNASTSTMSQPGIYRPQSQAEWIKALDELPSAPDRIPSFFFGHGSPALAFPKDAIVPGPMGALLGYAGPSGPLATFLGDFGPALLKKYNPKGIVVFSAHWETMGERLVTDYGDENPVLMDYYGFMPALYELKFKSKGSKQLSERVVHLYKEAGQSARLSPKLESRGEDGRGFNGPGLDHGVFVPFRIMFGEEFLDVPVVQVSIDESLDPEKNWALGNAVSKLREEGILILSGGLTIHNLRDMSSFNPEYAKPAHKAFDNAVFEAMGVEDPAARKKAMFDLLKHEGLRPSHPREEHFVPVYPAAGAGEEGKSKIICGLYGAPTVAFGL